MSASLRCKRQNGGYFRKRFHVPAGTYRWTKVEHRFTLDPVPRAGERPAAGTVILLCLGGTSDVRFDDVSLTRLPER